MTSNCSRCFHTALLTLQIAFSFSWFHDAPTPNSKLGDTSYLLARTHPKYWCPNYQFISYLSSLTLCWTFHTGPATFPHKIRHSTMHPTVGMNVLSDGKVFVLFFPFRLEVLFVNVANFTFTYWYLPNIQHQYGTYEVVSLQLQETMPSRHSLLVTQHDGV